MITLSFFEEFIIGAAASFLQILVTKLPANAVEMAAVQSALNFLQKLLAGQVSSS